SDARTAQRSAPRYPVRAQFLARANRLTRLQRANLAAALSTGTAVAYPLTAAQSAAVARATLADVTKARRNGTPSKPRRSRESLAEHIRRSSLAERLEAARAVGIDVIWDTMISPVIASEVADINTNA